MQPLRLLLALDDRYEALAEVAIASVLLHQPIEAVTILTPEDSGIPRLHRLCDLFRVPLLHKLPGRDSPLERLPEAARPYFYRLEAMASAGGVGRHLYLDADTLCIRSLEPLTSLRLEQSTPFAVCSFGRPMWDRQLCLGLASPYHYFNSGVMLYEAGAAADLISTQKVVDFYLENQPLCRFRDQCALNALLRERVVFLPAQYNYTSWMRERRKHGVWHDLRSNPMAHVLPRVRKDLAIVHFTGGNLPERLPADLREAPDRYWLRLRAALDAQVLPAKLPRYEPE